MSDFEIGCAITRGIPGVNQGPCMHTSIKTAFMCENDSGYTYCEDCGRRLTVIQARAHIQALSRSADDWPEAECFR